MLQTITVVHPTPTQTTYVESCSFFVEGININMERTATTKSNSNKQNFPKSQQSTGLFRMNFVADLVKYVRTLTF